MHLFKRMSSVPRKQERILEHQVPFSKVYIPKKTLCRLKH